jgi:hypothetical protein
MRTKIEPFAAHRIKDQPEGKSNAAKPKITYKSYGTWSKPYNVPRTAQHKAVCQYLGQHAACEYVGQLCGMMPHVSGLQASPKDYSMHGASDHHHLAHACIASHGMAFTYTYQLYTGYLCAVYDLQRHTHPVRQATS